MKLKIIFAFFGAACILSIFALLLLSKKLSVADEYMAEQDFKANEWVRINDHQEINIATPIRPKPPIPRKKHHNSSISHMIYPLTCPILVDYIPQSTIQMLDVYNDLKFDNPDGGVWKQGWKIEVDDKMWNAHHKLKVFVVPHSHNDPGWVKTFDEYYETETKHILDNMVDKLQEDSRRKFIWAEISFFAMWWSELDQESRRIVKSLLHKGQLEIVTGGWVMNDEANSHWIATLHQLTEGHLWLKKNLNYTPLNGWAIDPFGMSPTQAVFLKEMGLKNMLIQRVHYSIKKELSSKKQLEFFWRQLWDGNGVTDMFTHMMPFYSYDIPHTCGPDPKICCQFDFKRLPGFGLHCPWKVPPEEINDRNVEEKAIKLLDQYRKKSTLYKTNVLLIPLGDDFRYTQRNEWDVQFKNYQHLFDYINSKVHLNAHVKFGTLNDYFNGLHEENDDSIFPSLSGDFFTYADRDDHYWSGYYTSRPLYKRLDRVLIGYIKAAETLSFIAMLKNKLINYDFVENYLTNSRQSLGLFQHHDGITGTAKDYVMEDYGIRMLEAIQNCQMILQICTKILLSKENIDNLNTQLTYFNIDDIRTSLENLPEQYTITIGKELRTKRIVLYNSLTFSRKEIVTFIVSTPYIQLTNHRNEIVECQISPIFEYSSTISTTKYLISFSVEIPPISLLGYTITVVDQINVPPETNFAKITLLNSNLDDDEENNIFGKIESIKNSREFTIKNEQILASFNNLGLLKAIKVKEKTYPVHLDFASYGAIKRPERSGAYLFLPDKEAVPIKVEATLIRIVEGPILSSVRVQVPFVDHAVYLFNSEGADGIGLEIHNTVNIKSTNNFELAMRLSTNIKNGDDFFTDLNGHEIIRRKRFKKLPLQANYYPVPTTLFIEDKYSRLTLLSSTPLGGSSLKEGMIEVMLDRRLNQDDNLGLGQGVLDNRVIRQTFRIVLEPINNPNCQTTIDGHPSGFRTLASYVALETLLNPLIRMLKFDDIDDLESNQHFSYIPENQNDILNQFVGFGVDISVPIVRTGLKDVGYVDLVGLVLHRTMLDLCYSNGVQLERFPLSNGTIRLQNLFPIDEYKQIEKTTLSFMKRLGEFRKSGEIELCPMETQAFLLES
ncbi:alpha-mannosidase 2 [Onthophagus taurus]|uniref:alpha-mannosidase 2 n=1 Tax=Onthophagus taurus TaxID=166361 RepID=UPI0039BDED3C